MLSANFFRSTGNSGYRMRSHDIVCEKGFVYCCMYLRQSGLETGRKQIGDFAQKQFVFMIEGIFLVAINIYLADDLGTFSN